MVVPGWMMMKMRLLRGRCRTGPAAPADPRGRQRAKSRAPGPRHVAPSLLLAVLCVAAGPATVLAQAPAQAPPNAVPQPAAATPAAGPPAPAHPAVAQPSSGTPQPLSLAAAMDAAQRISARLPAHDAAARAARELAVAAAQLPDPVFKAGIVNLPVDGPDRFSVARDFMTMRSVGVMQEFTRADKRAARAARLERDADVAAAERLQSLLVLRQQVALAWFERHHWERVARLQEALRTEVQLQVDAADAAYRGGRGPQADVFAARAALAQIDDGLLAIRREAGAATARLARWVGGADATRPLAPPPDAAAPRLAMADLEQSLRQHHPQLVLKARQLAQAQAQADVARSNRRADWSAELMFSQRGSAYSNMVSLNLSLPLRWDPAQRQDREIAASLAQVEQVRLESEEIAREQLALVHEMVGQWQANRRRLELFDERLLPLAAERSRATLAAYRGGTAPLSAVLEARRGEITARLDRLQVELDNHRLWAQLEYLLPAGDITTPITERAATAQETTR